MFSDQFRNKIFIFFTSLLISGIFLSSPSLAEDLASLDWNEYKSSAMSSPKWDDDVKTGFNLFHEEKYESALEKLYAAFNKGCKSPIVIFQMALINEEQNSFYTALEYYKLAEQQFNQANNEHRYKKMFAENYGRALYNAGKKEEAYPFLKKAAKNTKSYWILKMLGMLSVEKSDTLNATAYFEMAVRLDNVPKEELLYCYLLLARLFVNQNEAEAAIRNYAKVAELDPQNQEALTFLNQAKEKSKQDELKKKNAQDYELFKKLLEEK